MSHLDAKLREREYGLRTGHIRHKRYEKTMPGFLMRLYRNMKIRVRNVDRRRLYIFEGDALMPKYEFYEWAAHCTEFHDLYRAWQMSGFDKKLTPRLERIDLSLGYITSNLEWTTL